jgi:Zn-dependent protease with chaperone function
MRGKGKSHPLIFIQDMKSYFGEYHFHGARYNATVLVFDKDINIGYRDENGTNHTTRWDIRDTRSDFSLSRQTSRLTHTRFVGQELFIEGKDAHEYLASLAQERSRPWHQRSRGKEWIRNILLMLGILGILFLLYLLIVPWMSAGLANKVSPKTERQLGDAVYNAMNLSSSEDRAKSMLLNEFFAELDIRTPYEVRITVINQDVVNAFALPGGRIVVYTALLKQINSYPALVALLSHEFIHVHNRHATRSIFRRLGSKVFLGLLFGNFGTVTAVLVDHADNLKSLSYSRKLEKEADTEGMKLLLERQVDPRGFEELFSALEAASPGNRLPEILASHPNTSKRKEYLREMGQNAKIADHDRLKAIFEEIKKQ